MCDLESTVRPSSRARINSAQSCEMADEYTDTTLPHVTPFTCLPFTKNGTGFGPTNQGDFSPFLAVTFEYVVSGNRAPGVWAVVPISSDSRAEPLLALYETQARAIFESMAAVGNYRVSDIADHPKVLTPEMPAKLKEAWRNFNEECDLETQ